MSQTFFEMLGNWSFGDYFKEDAIKYSWELFIDVFGLDPDRLYVTYFEGNKDAGIDPDIEAKELWMKVGVAEDHILPGNMKDNFWEMGETGPCGPCSEIHYDRIGGGRNSAHLVNMDDPNVLEIWNIVFMQYDRQEDRSLKSLPSKHIDTGMGFERLVSVLQDKSSNYDTDVFYPLFEKIQEITGARAYTDKYGKDDPDGIDVAYRVIADHIRLLTFAIADGGVPSNKDRGYVVRRVLRRGSRYAREYFKVEIGSFFSKILPALVKQMGPQFPEIVKAQESIKEILDQEEVAFATTLDRGEKVFKTYAATAKKDGIKTLTGAQVWRLYDTFGFPVDLTLIMAEEEGLGIDQEEVAEAQQKAKEASKFVKDAGFEYAKLDVHLTAELKSIGIPTSDDEAKFSKGAITSKIQYIFDGEKLVKSTEGLKPKQPFGILLDKTNFYAQSGGQIFDTGKLLVDDVAEFKVLDVQTHAGYILHSGYLEYGNLKAGNQVICEYDELRRAPIRNNHSGTHILNHALREHLGEDVMQKGSLVDDEKLRFDFSHKAPVTVEELKKIEDSSNAYIKQNCKIYAKSVDLDAAKKIYGLRAVFGEQYPNPVRVVSVGVPVDDLLASPDNKDWRKISVEFCGGTHVDQTGIIKDLVIVEESGIAKGIRRIIAFTGASAHKIQRDADDLSGRIDILEKMSLTPMKEVEAKSMQNDLNQATISTLTKGVLQSRLDPILKGLLDEQKKRQKAENKTALDIVKAHFTENKDSTAFIARLPISANPKAIAEVMNYMKKSDKTKSIYLLGGGEGDGVVHGVYVGTVSTPSSF
jgi:alanyl-tRNA synthetase